MEERAAERPDLVLSGDESAVRALFFEGASWARLEQSGKLAVTGDTALARRLERWLEPAPAVASQRRVTTRRKLSSKNSSVSSKRSAKMLILAT